MVGVGQFAGELAIAFLAGEAEGDGLLAVGGLCGSAIDSDDGRGFHPRGGTVHPRGMHKCLQDSVFRRRRGQQVGVAPEQIGGEELAVLKGLDTLRVYGSLQLGPGSSFWRYLRGTAIGSAHRRRTHFSMVCRSRRSCCRDGRSGMAIDRWRLAGPKSDLT